MIYIFANCVLDAERRELRRGDDIVAVEPQVFDLLQYLIRNRERVVSKDDLIASVWNGRVVSDSALSSRITAARHAIGDSGDEQRLIRTIARKGIRFVADVQEENRQGQNEAATATERSDIAPLRFDTSIPKQSPVLPIALTLPDEPSIVVLPFSNLSGDPGQEYFADGMVEDITIALGRLPQLFVIGSTSAFMYKNRAVDVRQVGNELGVRYVLRGSVRKDGNRLRITTQLSDASHGGHVWADRFEGELDSVFAMQDRVAAHVSAAISPALHTYEVRRSERKPTENLSAYDFFLRALPANQKSLSQNEEALRYLYKAIDLDPSYGAAYGLGAWCYTQQKLFGWLAPTDARLKEGIRFANKAAEAGKNDSEALWMAGYALTLIAGEFDRSLVVADKSISLNANSANAWWISGTARIYLGDTKNALHDLGRAQRLDPLSPLAEAQWMSIAIAHFFAGQYEEAAEAADKSLEYLTTYPPSLRLKIVTCGLLGRIDEGRTYVQRLLTLNPDTTVAKLKAYYDPLLRHNPRGLESYLKGLRLCGLPEGNSQ